jgi:hypothetical protein
VVSGEATFLYLFFNFLALLLVVAGEFGGWVGGGEMVHAT